MRLFRILRAYQKTKSKQKWPNRKALEMWQWKQVQRHLAFLQEHSPYFQNQFKNQSSWTKDAFSSLPTMDKNVMMTHFDEMNTAGISKEEAFDVAMQAEQTRNFSPTIRDVTVGLSSGTSGNRGLFLVSEHEQHEWTGVMLAKLLPRGLFSKERIAFFLRANSNLYESVSSRRIQFRFFDLLDNMEKHVADLQTMQPTILVSPPAMLRLLAEQIEQGRLTLSPIKVISVADVLDPWDEQYLSRIFNQPIHQVYQCTEGFLSSTCSHGTLHLNEDVVYVEKEFLDNDRRRFSPIITDFSRRTQPIIRYRLNDILTLAEKPCSCGSPFTALSQIEGRCDDAFYLPKQETDDWVLIFPDFIRRAIMSGSALIQQYKVTQLSPSSLEVQIQVADDSVRQTVEKQIQTSLHELFRLKDAQLPVISFVPFESKEVIHKLRRIERKPFSVTFPPSAVFT